MSLSNEDQTARYDQPDTSAHNEDLTDRELLEQIATDTAVIRAVLVDLQVKVENGAAAIPEIVDKLRGVPFIGGAIGALFDGKH